MLVKLLLLTFCTHTTSGNTEQIGISNKDVSVFKDVSFLQDTSVLYDYLNGYDHLTFICDVQKNFKRTHEWSCKICRDGQLCRDEKTIHLNENLLQQVLPKEDLDLFIQPSLFMKK